MECPLNSFTLHVMVFETLLKSKDSYIQEKSAKGFKMKITSDSSVAMRACKAARSLRSREGMSRAPSSWNLFHISDSEGVPSPPFRPADMMVGGSTRARASSPPAAMLLPIFVGDPLFPLSLAIVRSKGCLLCGGDPRLPWGVNMEVFTFSSLFVFTQEKAQSLASFTKLTLFLFFFF